MSVELGQIRRWRGLPVFFGAHPAEGLCFVVAEIRGTEVYAKYIGAGDFCVAEIEEIEQFSVSVVEARPAPESAPPAPAPSGS